MFELYYYEKLDGTKPAKDYIFNEDIKMKAKIFKTMSLLSEFGNKLRMPYSKVLDDGICELRIIQGADISRILYFFVVGNRIILTNGFRKKTQETPKVELELAKKYREDYKKRNIKEDGGYL